MYIKKKKLRKIFKKCNNSKEALEKLGLSRKEADKYFLKFFKMKFIEYFEKEKPKKEKGKPGRKFKEIDVKNFEKLCCLHCTLIEIAKFFECCEDTIERWCERELKMKFNEAFKFYSSGGKTSLRRSQFRVADAGNSHMLIWLGKQYLGQKDKREEIVEVIKHKDLENIDDAQEACDEYKALLKNFN